MPPRVYEGTQLILVGERSPKDKKFDHSEYLLAPPGTIVAPRRKGEPATEENALRALKGMATKMGGIVGKGPAGYAAFQRMNRTRKRGPKNLLKKAAAGAATDDATSQALQAIARVQAQFRDNPNAMAGFQNFANLDSNGAPLVGGSAPAGSDIEYAEGGGQFNNLLATLLGAAGITNDSFVAQLGVMNALGRIDPRALGVTDPAKFRELIAQGQGMPTLDKQKQDFNQTLYGFSRSSPNRGNVAATGVM